MQYETIELEKKEHICWIRFNRNFLNDFDDTIIQELTDAHEKLEEDPDVWGVLLGSKSEKFYCNGISPEHVLGLSPEKRAATFRNLMVLLEKIYSFSKPEIAVINGHCMAAGAFLAILTDFRIMTDDRAKFSFSEVHVGLTIPPMLLELVESVIGPQHITKATMLGHAYTAAEAHEIGLVDHTSPAHDLNVRAEFLLKEMFKLPLSSVRSIKKGIREKRLKTFREYLDSGRDDFAAHLGENCEEGLRAVLERRKPEFKNP